MGKKKHKNKSSDGKLNQLTQQKNSSLKQVERIQSQIADLQKLFDQEKRNRNALSEIENSYKKNRITHLNHWLKWSNRHGPFLKNKNISYLLILLFNQLSFKTLFLASYWDRFNYGTQIMNANIIVLCFGMVKELL